MGLFDRFRRKNQAIERQTPEKKREIGDIVNKYKRQLETEEARILRSGKHESKLKEISNLRRQREKELRAELEKVKGEVMPAASSSDSWDYYKEGYEKSRGEEKAKYEFSGGWVSPRAKQKITIAFIIIVISLILIFLGINLFVVILIGAGFFIWKLYGTKAALGFAVIGIILFAIFSTTTVGRALIERTGFSLTPMYETFKAFLSQTTEKVSSQITGVGEWKNPYATNVEEKKGIEITDITPLKQNFLPGEDIEVIGIGNIKALEEPTTVSFYCGIDNNEVWAEKPSLEVPANVDMPFSIRCKFTNVSVPAEDVSYKTVKFIAVYPQYKTDARLRLYLLSKEEKESLGGVDPFSKYEVQDSLLSPKYRTTQSTYKFGPLKVAMSISDRQPLSEGEYDLFISTSTDKVSWEGKLAYSESENNKLTLEVPENIEILTESCKIDIKIEDNKIYVCKIRINSMEQGLSYTEITAKAVYDYEFTKEGQVIIAKQGT